MGSRLRKDNMRDPVPCGVVVVQNVDCDSSGGHRRQDCRKVNTSANTRMPPVSQMGRLHGIGEMYPPQYPGWDRTLSFAKSYHLAKCISNLSVLLLTAWQFTMISISKKDLRDFLPSRASQSLCVPCSFPLLLSGSGWGWQNVVET